MCSPAGKISREAGRPSWNIPHRLGWKTATGVFEELFTKSWRVVGSAIGSQAKRNIDLPYKLTSSFSRHTPCHLHRWRYDFLHWYQLWCQQAIGDAYDWPPIKAKTPFFEQIICQLVYSPIIDARISINFVINPSEKSALNSVAKSPFEFKWYMDARNLDGPTKNTQTRRVYFVQHLASIGVLGIIRSSSGEYEVHGGGSLLEEHTLSDSYISLRHSFRTRVFSR